MIQFYIHTPDLLGWKSLIVEFLEKIESSNLDEAATKINICLNGNRSEMEDFLRPLLDLNSVFSAVHVSSDSWKCEWPTLNQLKADCDKSTGRYSVGYAHLKGLTKLNNKPVQDWKDYLAYWGIERWQDSVEQLEAGYDTSSVNWSDTPWPHYSGNFWWATSDYIRRLEPLPDPATINFGHDKSKYLNSVVLDPGNFRYEHEAWLGSIPGARRYELHAGPNKVDHDYHYHNEYPSSEYR